MRTIACLVEYDGSALAGFQRQPPHHPPTVQGCLEAALESLTGVETVVHGAGRTDAGVHALGQVVHFQTESTIPPDRFAPALNRYLPPQIVVLASLEAPQGFHARYSATGKRYRYTILQRRPPTALYRSQVWHLPQRLDPQAMAQAMKELPGEKDFRSFMASGSGVKSTIRHLREATLSHEGEFLVLEFAGNGFLYQMVRIMVGTLVEVGKGALDPGEIPRIIGAQDRAQAGPTAPPQGLTLLRVEYPEQLLDMWDLVY